MNFIYNIQIYFHFIRLLSDVMIFINMSRESLKPEERRIKFSVTINPILFNKIDELETNKSKYVEDLIYQDLIKNNQIPKKTKL